MKEKIVVAGHICLDIAPRFTPHMEQPIFVPGSLLPVEGVELSAGGAVANTGMALLKMGASASLTAKIGDDDFGRILQRLVGSAAALSVCGGERTSFSVVLAPAHIDRIFLHDAGANDTFCLDDINFNALAEAEWFHFGYPPLLRQMYQNNGEQLEQLFKRVKELGLYTSLDMAAVSPCSPAGGVNWSAVLIKALPYVDVFAPSAEELAFMLDKDLYGSWKKRAAGGDVTEIITLEEVKRLAAGTLGMGAKAVLVKCGGRGLYLCTATMSKPQGFFKSGQWSGLSMTQGCYAVEKLVSATGAGDTCIAAFILAVLRRETPRSALQLAAATGALCVQTVDALSGILPLEQLRFNINAGWLQSEKSFA